MGEVIATILFIIFLFAFIVFVSWLITDFVHEGNMYSKYKRYQDRNLLRECAECERLYRKYQIDLVIEAKGEKSCPHCGKYIYYKRVVEDPDKWMDTHSDCPKINLVTYLKISRAMKTVKKLNKEKASIERFEKYNNLKVDVDWIKKLQKDLNKE